MTVCFLNQGEPGETGFRGAPGPDGNPVSMAVHWFFQGWWWGGGGGGGACQALVMVQGVKGVTLYQMCNHVTVSLCIIYLSPSYF